MTSAVVVLVTVSSVREAQTLARTLLSEHLAACVNITSPIRSLYRWEGDIADEQEWQLVIKTQASLFEALAARVQALHSYDIPEIIALPILAGAQSYLDWIQHETRSLGQAAHDKHGKG